ncbi:hypothetical protein E3Q18_01615 [Wallemia mellicola]|nr:hypothetical protein E3Q18_01615 [Wallemia mellicola]
MKSQLRANEQNKEFSHLLLQINDDDSGDRDWGFRVYGVQKASRVLLQDSSTTISLGVLKDYQSLLRNSSTTAEPETIRELNIPSEETIKSVHFNSAITNISTTENYISAATETEIHILDHDLQILHSLESPCPRISSIANRYLAYLYTSQPPQSSSGILASKNLKYSDRPSYTTAEIASHVASYLEEGYKQGHRTFDVIQNYYNNTFSKSVPLTSPSIEASSPPLMSVSPASLAEQNGLFTRKPSVVRVLDIVSGRTVALFTASIANLSAISLSPSGRSILVADINAHTFHVYELRPRPLFDNTAEYDSVWHRYALRRGYTTARVTSIAWSKDERWCAVTTEKGTTHIYPLNPNTGGAITNSHVTGEPIKFGSKYTSLSTTLSSVIKIKSEILEGNHGLPRSVTFSFADGERSKLIGYTHDNDFKQLIKWDYKLTWKEFEKEDGSKHSHIDACLDSTSETGENTSGSQPMKKATSSASKGSSVHPSQIAKGEIETFDISSLRSIFTSRQFEFRKIAATDMLNNDVTSVLMKSQIYKVRPEVKVNKLNDDTTDNTDNLDLSSIQHIIPALPNGIEHKASLSLPDQHTLKRILKGSYKRISSTFGSPGSQIDDAHDDDHNSNENDVGIYKEAKDASEEADKFVVGLVDDDEEELE